MAVGPVGGMAFVKLNGLQYQLRGEFTVQPNTTENEWIANADGSMVFTQKAIVPYMQMKLSNSGGLSLQALAAMQGATMTAELNNGKVYVLQQSAPWGEITDDAIAGATNTVKLGGIACYEQLSAF